MADDLDHVQLTRRHMIALAVSAVVAIVAVAVGIAWTLEALRPAPAPTWTDMQLETK